MQLTVAHSILARIFKVFSTHENQSLQLKRWKTFGNLSDNGFNESKTRIHMVIKKNR